MVVALLSQAMIADKFIRMRRGTLLDILLNDWMERFDFAVRHNLSHYLPTALQHPKHNSLVFGTATAAAATQLSAYISFINLNIAKQRKFAVNIFHVLTNQMRHAPRRLVCYAKLSFQLLRRNAVTGSGEQVNGIEPKLQRRSAILKWRPHGGMQMMTAPLTGVGAFGLKTKPLGRLVAFWADMALPEADIKQMLKALFILRKAGQKLADCWAIFHLFRRRFHMSKSTITAYLCQGDNSEKGFLF
jgi:hypothetical protein